MRRSVLSFGSWPRLPRITGPALAPTFPHHHFQPPTRDLLLALGHLQGVEVNDALHVGVEGEEATQEVIPSQVEFRVLSRLTQNLHQEEQGADCPGLGSHGWEAGIPRGGSASPEHWLLDTRGFAQTFT